jgi:hypothetical protein
MDMNRLRFGLAFANVGPFVEPDAASRLAQTGDEALAEAKTLRQLGATRVLIPAASFGADPVRSLQRFGEDVIGEL